MQPIEDYGAFFNQAKQAISDAEEMSRRVSELTASKNRLSSQLDTDRKKVADQIESTIAKRRSEITGNYDSELSKGQEQLRKARARREKAKNQGMKERISDETAQLRTDIRSLKNEIKGVLHKAGLPGFCNSRLFYALYLPRNIGDFLIILLAFAIVFAGIPLGIWHIAFHGKSVPALILIYVIVILIFGGLYILIGRMTIYKDTPSLENIRALRRIVRDKEDSIRDITKSIQMDTNEEKYNLGSFDDEIAHAQQQLADTTMRRQEALDTFENVTRQIIVDEINTNNREHLEGLKQQLAAASGELMDAEQQRNTRTLNLSNYEVYLGKSFMKPDRIDALRDIMEHGTAKNISEAIEEYNRKTEI